MARFPDLPPLVVQLLYNRQARTTEEVTGFLERRFATDDPYLLKGMNAAVARLRRAVCNDEAVAVYGDYDVDGVTATALLVLVLRGLGARAQPYIPKRKHEGYGLHESALEELARQGVKVVVTVDCGVRSVDEARFACRQGLDLIITDHHNVPADLPPAVAVIDPRRADEDYPFTQLAGVGLAYKLAQGLLRAERQLPVGKASGAMDEESLLDLVALGTIADLAPLTGENRALVARGLERLNEARRPGIAAMLQETALRPGQVDARTVGYVFGPRLNAAGRLDDAIASYNLLTTTSAEQATALARQLSLTNQERQRLMKDMVEHARQEVAAIGDASMFVLSSSVYAAGIAGLVASRITEEFYRPTIVIAVDEDKGQSKGSARSVDGFHISRALEECDELLVRHGGHKAAAGFTISNDKIGEFRARMLALVGRQLTEEQLQPTLLIDMELPLFAANLETLQLIERLQPFGMENQRPIFAAFGARVCSCRSVGSDNRTLKFRLSDGTQMWDAVAFRQDRTAEQVPQRIDIAYGLQANDWNGRISAELIVQDWRSAKAWLA
jgi:single-stranded-DNA-specific exonuclease